MKGAIQMLINENLILINLLAAGKEEAVGILAETAASAGRISNPAAYKASVLRRELDYSTAIGFGAAIAHGKSESVIEPFLMYASVKSLFWQAQDSEPVNMIFLIGIPANASPAIHLQILARLSRLLMRKEFRTQLQEADSASSVMKVLKDYDVNF